MTYEEYLIQTALADPKVYIMTAENRAALRTLPTIVPEKFIDTGITEQTLVGMAAGLALRGKKPIIHALAAFLTMRAFEFIRTDVGISNLPVKIVGSFSGFLSEANGPTHQAIEDISLMRGIPKMNIFCPSDEDELVAGMPSIVESNKPFYIRYNNLKSVVEHKPFELGKSELICDGNDITILTYGILFNQALKATEILKERGVSVRLINLRTIRPLDKEAIFESIKKTNLIVTIEDHFLTGGLFSIISELIVKNSIVTQIFPIALKNKWFKPALMQDVLEYEGFTGIQIANKIENFIIKKRTEYYVEWSCFQ